MPDTYPSLPLDGLIRVSHDEYRTCAHWDDCTDSVPVSWAMRRADGSQVGGAYLTHAGASQTMREFPDHFRGAHIVPIVMRRHEGAEAYRCRVEGRGPYYGEEIADPLWPELWPESRLCWPDVA